MENMQNALPINEIKLAKYWEIFDEII